jgi:hypothetical protein
MTRSSSYKFTFDPSDDAGWESVHSFRKDIKKINEEYKKNNVDVILRVCLKGRLGENNPNSKYYKNRTYQTIKLQHASRIDVYVYERYQW